MGTFVAHIANFTGGGEVDESLPLGMRASNRITLRVAKRVLELEQDPEIARTGRSAYRETFARTTTITVRNVHPRDEEAVLQIVRDVCWLLSLASMSKVLVYAYEYPDAASSTTWSVMGTVGRSWPLIDDRFGKNVRKFVESTFGSFRRLRKKRRLQEVIDVLISAEMSLLPHELSMIAVYVAMEMMRDSWGRQRGFPVVDGYFMRPREDGKGLRRYGLRDMLRTMCREVGMRPELASIVNFRNALVHSGGVRLRKHTKVRVYREAQALAREYLLRLLGYRGQYVAFGSGVHRFLE